MIEELLYQQPPVRVDRLKAQQERERADRNAATLRTWYRATFGVTCGDILWREHMENLL